MLEDNWPEKPDLGSSVQPVVGTYSGIDSPEVEFREPFRINYWD